MNSSVARVMRRCKRTIGKKTARGGSRETRVNRRDESCRKKKLPKKKKQDQQSIVRPYRRVPAPPAAGNYTPTGATEQMHACMHCIKPSGSLSFRRISKHIREYMHTTHTIALQPRQCLTREVIDFDAWYTGVKNEVKLTVGCRLWKKSQ